MPGRDSDFLYLTTLGWKSGKPHRIEIWFAEYEGKYYIVAEYWLKAHWIQNAKREPKISLTVAGKDIEGTARVVDRLAEPALAGEVAARMKAKYGWGDGLVLELTPRS
ncbi:MAG: nitroreductase/quinone reductase family protein [Thaumarchaeota archaeon]|nr:nitroreductase/quinone reductase family protein [Nitrososphaerota archaeon]